MNLMVMIMKVKSILKIDKSSVIRQKGRISKRVFQENKAHQFSEKRTFLTPCYAHLQAQGVRNACGKFDVLCFLETPFFEICPFALLPMKQEVQLQWTPGV